MRCLIVEDIADFVDAARGLLERQGITVVGVASTSAEALRCFEELRPDVTLVDIDLGGESGFELAEQLHRAGSAAPSPVILDLHPRRPGLRGHDRDEPGRRVRIQVRPDGSLHSRAGSEVSGLRGR